MGAFFAIYGGFCIFSLSILCWFAAKAPWGWEDEGGWNEGFLGGGLNDLAPVSDQAAVMPDNSKCETLARCSQ